MDKNIFNLSALRKLMKEKPIGQRLWLFFKGYANNLTKAQCKDLINVINKEHDKTIKFITKTMEECTN